MAGSEPDGGAGASGDAGSAGAAGVAGAAGAAGCAGGDTEPNGDVASAQELTDITDCDAKGFSFSGTADGSSDEDWYTLHAADVVGCSVDPNLAIQASQSTELCAYFLCDTGDTSVSCFGASTAAVTAMGDKGCCTEALSISPEVECSGTNDSVQVWIRVRTLSPACVGYKVQLHY